MGLEQSCEAILDGRRLRGVAHLEPGELRFAGKTTLRIPLAPSTQAVAAGGVLTVEWPEGTARFELGERAEAWALKIRYPRARLDKLGVKDDTTVALIGLADEAFEAELGARAARVTRGRVPAGTRMAIVHAGTVAALDKLAGFRAAIAEDGAIWVVWPKGQKALTETHVREAAKAQGLVDVKVMSFSETLSALKLMIPRAQRKKSRSG
jgi:hypothetical protein